MTAPAATVSSAPSCAARIAAFSGLVFAVLFVVALVLLHRSPTLGDPDSPFTAFYANGGDQLFVAVGLYLVPVAGIAFLWHMTAMRNVLDTLTPPPSAMAHGLNLLAGIILLRNAGVLPKVPAVVAYLLAAFLLLAVTNNPIAVLVLPAWVVLISVLLLRHGRRAAVPALTYDAAGPDTAGALDTSRPSMRSDPS